MFLNAMQKKINKWNKNFKMSVKLTQNGTCLPLQLKIKTKQTLKDKIFLAQKWEEPGWNQVIAP